MTTLILWAVMSLSKQISIFIDDMKRGGGFGYFASALSGSTFLLICTE